MGEVYRARDTRLERTVAIKVLPKELSADSSRKQRFEREAKTISSLNHPHICTLHDIGSQDGVDYLVMECVEGETLAKRLEKGPLPLEQVLKYGAQIADALDKAHRAGIVHRDLKPGNIMLTSSGVKLLDFGLAKPVEGIASGLTVSVAAVHSSPVTQEGTIVGTFQYMSPEQVEGKEVDGRSDIFSLGAVLYEMLTGQRAFEGKSQLSVASAILEKEPAAISEVKPMTPPALDHAIRRCLAKDPEERWQTARDLAQELKWIVQSGSQAGTASAAPIQLWAWLGWGLAALATLVAIFIGIMFLRRTPAPGRVVRAYILPPPNTTFSSVGIVGAPLTVSPDGQRFVFGSIEETGKQHLWVQGIDSVTAQPLPGTEGGTWPFWSPDGRSVGFFSEGKLKKTDASGGPVQTLCEAAYARGGAWSTDGTILFASTFGPLYRVSESGGTPSAVTKLDESRHESSHRWPYFLPDGHTFVFFVRGDQAGIYAGKLGSQESRFLLETDTNAAYALPGYLLFWREGSLMAQPFDAQRLQLNGRAEAVAEHIVFSGGQSFSVFSVSQTGVLAVRAGGITGSQVYWFDRNGKQLELVDTENGVVIGPRLSPDEHKLAVMVADPRRRQQDVWIHDLSRGVRTRFTFEPALETNRFGAGMYQVWSPDGTQIAFSAFRHGHLNLYSKQWGGAGEERVLLEDSSRKQANSWSPDGRFLAYQQVEEKKDSNQIWILPLFGDRRPFAFLKSSFAMFGAEFSPDGRWLAYTSVESGNFQVYVAAFPGGETKMQVSPAGGMSAKWRSDGKELFYLDLAGRLMKVDVKSNGGKLELGAPQMLFQTMAASPGIRPFDVTKNGDRFIFTTAGDVNPNPFMLIVNWDAELKKK
jgi:Tol biopolymer transport system component/tRNA A-37 threonylcarbamoyl transferase component Bud32